MSQPSSWRFNQSYEERQEAYKHKQNAHGSRSVPLHVVPRPRSQSSKLALEARALSLNVLPKRNLTCPCTPPNTSREKPNYDECWDLIEANRFMSPKPDTAGGDQLYDHVLEPLVTPRAESRQNVGDYGDTRGEPGFPYQQRQAHSHYSSVYNPILKRMGAVEKPPGRPEPGVKMSFHSVSFPFPKAETNMDNLMAIRGVGLQQGLGNCNIPNPRSGIFTIMKPTPILRPAARIKSTHSSVQKQPNGPKPKTMFTDIKRSY